MAAMKFDKSEWHQCLRIKVRPVSRGAIIYLWSTIIHSPGGEQKRMQQEGGKGNFCYLYVEQ